MRSRHDRPARAHGGIIPETSQIFMTVLVYLSEPYQNIGIVVLCWRIALSVMAGFLNKVIFLLPQRTNIAREQMLMAYAEPPVLNVP